ncbi:hypothetical protein N7492_004548 [Penicillium capsulatum]|uniref:F-box domain-containing protein n=1 Tax=Penicillium capsulatum TaxID=69766 RepID=A0A9W9LR25_9EURO|nr:hypothetical protein N7492_004548 [Penicillium capsulatum]KAJ6136334.1 hypothetical protein N7512_001494 [Penicillium capsulatum]
MSAIKSPSTVCDIPELLELILLHLDLRTLLTTAQSTCRAWTSLIRNSPRIQQALFFASANHREKVYNPLLAEKFSPFFPNDSPGSEYPLFTFTACDMFKTPDQTNAFMRKEASWRRMLVQQPPVPGIGYIKIRHAMRHTSYAQSKMTPRKQSSEPGYVRMQHLFEAMLFGSIGSYINDGAVRIRWPAHEEIESPRARREPHLEAAFERMVARFEIVVHVQVSVSCVRGMPAPKSEKEMLRDMLRALYEKDDGDEEGGLLEEVDIKESILRDDALKE